MTLPTNLQPKSRQQLQPGPVCPENQEEQTFAEGAHLGQVAQTGPRLNFKRIKTLK